LLQLFIVHIKIFLPLRISDSNGLLSYNIIVVLRRFADII